MTISTTNINKSYSGNGSTHSFAYDFPIFADADLTVVVRSAAGAETTKTLNTHYIVTGSGASSGGNVLFKFNTGTSSDAHFSATDHRPASGETVVIRSELANTQTLDLVANDPFPASAFETALDKLVRMVQQHEEELDRSIKLSRTNTMTSTEFTTSSTDRASKVLAFDSSGELSVTTELGEFKGDWSASTSYALRDIVKDTSTNNIFIAITAHTSSGSEPLTTNTDSAKWSLLVDAATATTAQTAAASSASSASTSASTATTKAAESSTSASNASTSETNSASSATASASSAAAAASSATSAANSAATLTTGISEDNIFKAAAGVVDDDFLRVDGTKVEGRSASEVLSDIAAAPAAGSSNIVTTGALNSGSITSGFGSIDNGSSAVTTTGVITGGTLEATADTSAGDNAAIGFTAAEGLILTGQGSTNDVTIKNDADADVLEIPTGTTNVTVVGNITAGGTVAGADALSNRNMVVNGAMKISSRGTSFTGFGAAVNYSLDRFAHYHSSDGAFTISQETSVVPDDFTHSLKIQTTTADASISAGQRLIVFTRLEGNTVSHLNWGTSAAKTVTLSFYVRSSITGTHGGAIGNGSDNRNYPFTYTISAADTWERKTVTIAGDTSGTWATGTGRSLQVVWGLGVGSTYSGTAGAWASGDKNSATGATTGVLGTLNATWYLTGVQLEVGSVTPFEHENIGITLQKCQRHYYKLKSSSANNFFGYAMAANTTAMYLAVPFPVEMRSNPTSIDVTAGSSGNIGYWLGGAVTAFTSIGISESGPSMTTLVMQVSSGLSAEKMYGVLPNGNGSIGFNSEL